jgi:hypothetical protein
MKLQTPVSNGKAAAKSCRNTGMEAAKQASSVKKRQKKHGMAFAIDWIECNLNISSHDALNGFEGKQ